MVVDHVEDHLDVGFMQGTDHRLELLDLTARGGAAGVLGVGGKEADGVVAALGALDAAPTYGDSNVIPLHG